MGYEHALVRDIDVIIAAYRVGLPASLAIQRPAKLWAATREECDHRGIHGTSPNQRQMGCDLELARAAAWGTGKEYEAAAAEVSGILDMHLNTIGLWLSEQATGLPHGGFYTAGHAAARIGAIVEGDTALRLRLDEYHRRMVSYMILTATPGGEVWCCGERMGAGPAAIQQAAWLREVRGLPQRGEQPDGDDQWVGLRGLRALIARGDKLAGARDITVETATFPLVARPVEVRRWDGGHLARYVGKPPHGTDGVCDWVCVDHHIADSAGDKGAAIMAGVTYGTEWRKPVPVIPQGAHGWRSTPAILR